jgi:hypothetical protein
MVNHFDAMLFLRSTQKAALLNGSHLAGGVVLASPSSTHKRHSTYLPLSPHPDVLLNFTSPLYSWSQT